MGNLIHYEIFVRRRGGWTLHDALEQRNEAKTQAKDLLGQSGIIEVKVVKETQAEDGTFQSVSIFEAGEKEVKKKKPAAAEETSLPCFRPEDLHSAHARATIARVLKAFLEEHRVTPMELIHSGPLLEKLEARSTVLQGAVQQVSIAMASGGDISVQDIFRKLMDLALLAMDRVVTDDRKGRFKELPSGSIAGFAAKLPAGADLTYLLAAAIAKRLRKAREPNEKLTCLLELLGTLPPEGETRKEAARVVDAFAAETLRMPNALSQVIGKNAELGDKLRIFADLFLGRTHLLVDDAASLRQLAQVLKAGLLPSTMSALSDMILTEIRGQKRLHPSDFETELGTIRHLAQQLVYGIGEHLSIEDLTDAFTMRSRRLVTQETISTYLNSATGHAERIEKLLDLEENIVGAQSKRVLASYIQPLIASVQFESQMLDEQTHVLARLKRIADLQMAAKRAKFEDADKLELTDSLGRLAEKVEARGQFFKQIETKSAPPADKAFMVMRLLERGAMPKGLCWERARTFIRSQIKKPDFAQSLCPDHAKPEDHAERRAEFRRLFDELELGPPKPASKQPQSAA